MLSKNLWGDTEIIRLTLNKPFHISKIVILYIVDKKSSHEVSMLCNSAWALKITIIQKSIIMTLGVLILFLLLCNENRWYNLLSN